MKKILPILLVGILVLSGLGAADINVEKIAEPEIKQKIESTTISFSANPELNEKDNYLCVYFKGANSQLSKPGEPVLPVYLKSFQIPAKASNIQVSCQIQEIKTLKINNEIIPGEKYISRADTERQIDISLCKNEQIYMRSEWYPKELYDYKVTCGRNDENIIVNFVDIQIHPVQYSPGKSELRYVLGDIEIEIAYEVAIDPVITAEDSYDLVIIAPEKFLMALNRLVKHKNRFGLDTLLKPVEEIYDEYNGRDKPEQIKYFIKDAIEQWNINYVLLVGGLKSYIDATDREDRNQGSDDWWIPVRYTNVYLYDKISDEKPTEPGCPSDLYYADVFKAGQVFDDWDSNDNDIFAEADADMRGHSNKIDILDLRPDVYVGRLACRNIFEVRVMVNKIIRYERTDKANEAWFKNMICIAGKTFSLHQGMPDGEFVCEQSLEYMGDSVEPIRVYVSNNGTDKPRPIPNDITSTISDGAGFVSFQGHGSPCRWDTIWEDGEYPYGWAGGLMLYNFWKLFNLRKLPIIVIGGCHNGLFNVTMKKTSGPNNEFYWTHGIPTPVCFGWGLCIVPYGGAIASIAGTGLGIGIPGDPVCLSAELETNFFFQIGQNNAETFGQAHGTAINKYITENPNLDATEYHCITIYQPFGDPSLKIGGYQ